MKLASLPWWSPADAAELDLLTHELVDGYSDHLPGCEEKPCSHLGVAIQAVLDWRCGRELTSRATYLRAGQDILDAQPGRRGGAACGLAT